MTLSDTAMTLLSKAAHREDRLAEPPAICADRFKSKRPGMRAARNTTRFHAGFVS